MFFGASKSDRAKKYVDEVFDQFDVDNSGELSYEGKCHLQQCANHWFRINHTPCRRDTQWDAHGVRETYSSLTGLH